MSEYKLGELKKWLQTLVIQAAHSTVEEISSGQALADALTLIAPEWFTFAWNSTIKSHINFDSNWRLKFSNLKKITEAIHEYYNECLHQPLPACASLDVEKIAKNCDKQELCKLLQLVLDCAINCDEREYFINAITDLEESTQKVIMQCILEQQENVEDSSPKSLVMSNHEQTLTFKLEAAEESIIKLVQKCNELEEKLTLVQTENNTLVDKNKEIKKKLKILEELEKNKTSLSPKNTDGSKIELLERKVFELQMKELSLLDAARQVYHILRESADRVEKLESVIEKDKKGTEDLYKHLEILKDKSINCIQSKIMHIEGI